MFAARRKKSVACIVYIMYGLLTSVIVDSLLVIVIWHLLILVIREFITAVCLIIISFHVFGCVHACVCFCVIIKVMDSFYLSCVESFWEKKKKWLTFNNDVDHIPNTDSLVVSCILH